MRLGSAALLLGLIALVAFILGSVQTLRLVPKVAKVTEVRGEVLALLPPRLGRPERTMPLKVGSLVLTGTEIRTGVDSSVSLHWADEVTLKIGPKSKLKVTRSRFDRATKALEAIFRLGIGSVFVKLQKSLTPQSVVELETPGVTAAVRGTAFWAEVNQIGETLIRVSEGIVSLRPRLGNRLNLKANDSVLFAPSGRLLRSGVTVPPEG
ncbi:MAG: FecR domain-containing protein [Armatimonadetes bacterium]|nr:FecR domain-containing protein [Armatimonadota bacterium]MDW8121524.1 FecR domain-containing protein [Armatimonadota bacterium]